jgi:hypothetical protein
MRYVNLLIVLLIILSINNCERNRCNLKDQYDDFKPKKLIFTEYSLYNEIEFNCIDLKHDPKRIKVETYDGKSDYLEEGMCVGKENYCVVTIGNNNSFSFDGFYKLNRNISLESFIVAPCIPNKNDRIINNKEN